MLFQIPASASDSNSVFSLTSRRLPLLSIALVAIFTLGQLSARAAEAIENNARVSQRPNVVIVITDDQGYGDLSCHGNPVLKTPQLDELYAQSVRLTDYHVAPTCSPTRASLQTGRWANRTGVWHTIAGHSLLRDDETTMGEIFRDAGYATGMFGKWHLGDNFPYRPEDRGYTEVFRHGGGGVGQTPDYWDNAYFDGSYWHNGEPVKAEGYCTDVFFDRARAFIKREKERGKPFLAVIATNTPHGPEHAPEEFAQPYAEDRKVTLAHFYGMIANIDANVGRLRAFLDEESLTENTIFIFTTDNGTARGAGVFNAGMRGNKGSQFDGGHRVPLFVHWPAGEFTGGRDVEPLTHVVDLLPTLIELCDVEPTKRIEFDGRSLAGLIRGDETSYDWDRRIMITDSQRIDVPEIWRKSSVMTSEWRLIDGEKLYNIKSDPMQTRDVSKAYPGELRRLTEHYQSWWEELRPTFKDAKPLYIGGPSAKVVTLTGHDWIQKNGIPWNQRQVRKGVVANGHWVIKVVEAGEYEFSLRRWPAEANAAIDAGLPAGEPVPGVSANRTEPGVALPIRQASLEIGGFSGKVDVQPGSTEVTFKATLDEGLTKLTANFMTDSDQVIGAYYVTARKTD